MAAAKRGKISGRGNGAQARARATTSAKRRSAQSPAPSRGKQARSAGRGQARGYAQEPAEDFGQEAASFTRSASRSAQHMAEEFARPVSDGVEQIMRSWMGFFQRAALSQQRLMQDMLELGSGRRVFEAQRAFIDDSLHNFADSTKEVLRASGKMAEPAVRNAERAAGFGQAYFDHEQAQHRGANGRGGYGDRRRQEEQARR